MKKIGDFNKAFEDAVNNDQGDMGSIIKKGFAQAIDGENLLINTQDDELIQIHIKDKKTRWDLYCKHLKITIEVIDKTELI